MGDAVEDSVILLESDEETVPSKRARGRPKRQKKAATSERPCPKRKVAGRPRRPPTTGPSNSGNVSVINVGDIDSDEAPESSHEDFSHPPVAAQSGDDHASIGLDHLAHILGISDVTDIPKVVETRTDVGGLETAQTSRLSSDISANIPLPGGSVTCDSVAEVSVADACGKEPQPPLVCSEAPAPKKTVRRGLAKKNSGLVAPASAVSGPVQSHVTAVYSQCVATSAFRSYLQARQPDQAGSSLHHESSEFSTTQSESETDQGDVDTLMVCKKSRISQGAPNREEDVGVVNVAEGRGDDDDDAVEVLRSPTPPPQHRRAQKPRGSTGKRKALDRKLSNALQALSNLTGRLGKTTPARHKAKGRRSGDLVITGEEEGIVKKDMVVKVRYLSTVHRIHMDLDAPLYTLISQLVQIVGDVDEVSLKLFLRDQVLESCDTPRSIGLSVADILECHQIKSTPEAEVPGDESISLVVQCRHSRAKTTVTVSKRWPLSELIKKYAELSNIDTDSLHLNFDGEDLNPNDWPGKLDMEDGDIIDVIVSR